MKALFFVNSLANGGAERVCINMAKCIVEKGGSVDFIILYGDSADTSFTPSRVLDLGLVSSDSKLKQITRIIISKELIDKFIRNNKYDLVTAHLPMSHICAVISDIGKKTIYVQHTSLLSNKVFSNLYKLLYFHRVNVCVSEGLKKEFIKSMGCSSKNVYCIYNPVNYMDIKKKAVFAPKPGYKYFLCVGRLCAEKRFDRAIDVFYQGGFYKEYKLVILGNGVLENKLKEQVKHYGIEDKVVFLGWVNNVYSWMINAELLLQTSDKEALPMVLIEGLACGVKIVASNCAYGADEILIGDQSRYIAQYDDLESYISIIKDALNFYPDISESALDRFTDNTIISKYLQVYNEVFL